MLCVVVLAFVVIIAGVFQRAGASQLVNDPSVQSFPIQVGGSYSAFSTWQNSNGPIAAKTPIPVHTGPYSVLGKPTITADLINRVLSRHNSPPAGPGPPSHVFVAENRIAPLFSP